jgi:biotin carboxylase
MIAKLIVHAADRPRAVARLRDALGQFQISGVATNLRLLQTIVAHPDFLDGRFDTRWLENVLLPGFIERKDH